ncbi:polyamine ABC transporter substrate-binding protein [Clostridium vincentii]|uniref:Spermidine/putrescine-binding periplasmic protein n=1 Tax=Clostridium vincentii TaxID=52704 RepID=A0A2T0BAT5_9CLOT|nr:spermidine/putrescine ABC transporter substrate-binding protein [Clostridium vincentii]PRR81009.1 Spermidine/putrescine-binding periplasmic protein precursor [Clostridium vincentii]
MSKKPVKKMLAFAMVAVLASTAVVGCGKSSSQEELNVFNWTEYIPSSVIVKFEEETGIKVNYSTYSSNEECLAKVESSAEGTYDVIVPSDYMVTIMKEKGLLEELNKDNITNFSNVSDVYLNKEFDKDNKYSVPFDAGAALLAVDTAVVKDNITSYNDLLNPNYANSLVVLDDQRALIGIALKALGYSLNETDDAKLAEAKVYLENLKPNIKAYDSDSPKTLLINGEASIGFLWNAECALAMDEKSSIKPVYPKEGMYLFIDSFAIPKGSKNKDNAEKFIDFLLSPEISKMVTDEFPYKNVNNAAYESLEESYKNNGASNVPDEEMAKGEFVIDVGDATTKFDKLWAEVK